MTVETFWIRIIDGDSWVGIHNGNDNCSCELCSEIHEAVQKIKKKMKIFYLQQ